MNLKKYPECPLVNPTNCREMHNPKLCAITRNDKACLRAKLKKRPIKEPAHKS